MPPHSNSITRSKRPKPRFRCPNTRNIATSDISVIQPGVSAGDEVELLLTDDFKAREKATSCFPPVIDDIITRDAVNNIV